MSHTTVSLGDTSLGLLRLVLLYGGCAVAVGQEPPAASLTVEQILERASERHNAIKSLRVKYHVTSKQLLTLPGERDGQYDGEEFVEAAYLGDRRLLRYAHVPKEGKEKHYITLYDGSKTFEYAGGMVLLRSGKKRSLELDDSFTRRVLQIPVMDEEQVDAANRWFFPAVLSIPAVREKYVVRAKQEEVDGVWCHVLEYVGHDGMWIDPELGCTFRRRESFEPVGKDESVLYLRSHLGKFLQKSGVSLPQNALVEAFPLPSKPQEWWNKKCFKKTINVEEIVVNEVVEDDFDVEIPSGTWVITEKAPFRAPGDRTAILGRLDVEPEVSSAKHGSRVWMVPLNIILIVVLVGIGYYLQRRRV